MDEIRSKLDFQSSVANTLPVNKSMAQMPVYVLDVTGAPGQLFTCFLQKVGQLIKEQAHQTGVPVHAGKEKGPMLLK